MHCFVLLFVDMALVSVSTLLAIVLCSPELPFAALAHSGQYAVITSVTAIPVLMLFRLNRMVWRFTSLSDAIRAAAATAAIVALSMMIGFSLDCLAGVPRAVPVMQALLVLYALVAARLAMRLRHLLRQRFRNMNSPANGRRENVLVIGLNPAADLFFQFASVTGHARMEIVGILSNAERHRGRFIRSREILGAPESIHDVLQDLAVHGIVVDRVVLTSPIRELSMNAQMALRNIEKDGQIYIDCLSTSFDVVNAGARNAGGATFVADGKVHEAGLPSTSYLRWKRLIDVAAALVGIALFAPLMLFVFVVVRLDVGAPAIFWQQRPGAGGRQIKILKFRTMGPVRTPDGRVLSDVERISRFGCFLRRVRLDELPQVFNILAGHMSFVGPRPLLPIDQPKASVARLRLRPGLTGWAQIKGGRSLSIEDKAALDLWYIKNASFTLDLVILAETIRTVLFGERVDLRAIHKARQDIAGNDVSLTGKLPEDAFGHTFV
ncbi:MAG: sugar transferase [Proteobacteria bacterium]|nr:sugar transferase [Pseudomonadota bacterium]